MRPNWSRSTTNRSSRLATRRRRSSRPIHPDMEGNVAYERKGGDPAALESLAAATVVEGTIDHPRVVPQPTRDQIGPGRVADGALTVHLSSQAPHLMAEEFAKAFGMAQSSVRVVTPFVGGSFGCKFDLAQEEMLAVIAARRCRRPVRWVESRRDHIAVIGHGRAQRHHYRAIAGPDGRILGLWVDSIVDLGCRQRYLAPVPATPRIGTVPTTLVSTPGASGASTPTGRRWASTGGGTPGGDVDTGTGDRPNRRRARARPGRVRRVNMVGADRFPYASAGGYTFDSGDYPRALDRLLELSDYAELRRTQDQMRRQGRYLGIGLGAYVEACGFEEWEAGRVTVHPDGSVTASAGTLDQGQGHRTAFAQIVAAELGIEATQVRVEQGDTAPAPYGWGTSGSRSVAHGGSGVLGAARLLAPSCVIAAYALEAAPEDVVLSGGVAAVREPMSRSGGRNWRQGLVRPLADPRRGAGVGGGASLRLRRAQLPVWDPPRGGRGRPVRWRCGPATDVGGGRRRCDRQPDAGRWSAPRRARPRNRSGYVGRGSLRPGRQPAHRSMVDYLLPTATCPASGWGRPAHPARPTRWGPRVSARQGPSAPPRRCSTPQSTPSPLGVTDLQIPSGRRGCGRRSSGRSEPASARRIPGSSGRDRHLFALDDLGQPLIRSTTRLE